MSFRYMIKAIIAVFIASYVFDVRSVVYAQQRDEDAIRNNAVKFMTRVENVPSFAVHAHIVDEIGQTAEVWLEMRGDSYWCESLHIYENDRKALGQTIEKLRQVGGGSDRHIEAFDGSKTYAYLPLQMEARISRETRSVPSLAVQSLFPRNWTCFHQYYHQPALRFSDLLSKDARSVAASWRENEKLMRFNHKLEKKFPDALYTERWIDVDPAKNFAVVRYEVSGGTGIGVWKGEFDWKEKDGIWYVEKGKLMTGAKTISEWKIDEFSSDAKKVHHSFVMDESKLPFATRITETDINAKVKTEYRFVGGEDGKKEHDLRSSAIMKVRSKK